MSFNKPFWNRQSRMSLPAIAMAALLAPLASHASAFIEEQNVVVSFADLDLGSTAGVEVLKHRIRRAAERVCGEPASRDLYEEMRYRDCVRDATERALEDVRARSK